MDRPQPFLFAAVLMIALVLGGGLGIDGSGVRPTVVAAVITAAAPLAVFTLRRGDPVPYLRVSEGYLWAVTILAFRAQSFPAVPALTWIALIVAAIVGAPIAVGHTFTGSLAEAKGGRRIALAIGAIAAVFVLFVAARSRYVTWEDAASLQPVAAKAWTEGTPVSCEPPVGPGHCVFSVEGACAAVPARPVGHVCSWGDLSAFETGCPPQQYSCDGIRLEVRRLPNGRGLVAWNPPQDGSNPPSWQAGHLVGTSGLQGDVPYAWLGRPILLPKVWLMLAAIGATGAASLAIALAIRTRLRRRHQVALPEDGPYRRVASATPAPFFGRAPAAWRYARLLALATLLPADVTMLANLALATVPVPH